MRMLPVVGGGAPASAAGPVLLGTIDFAALGSADPATYTAPGAQTVDDLPIDITTASGTDTLQFSAAGAAAVGGTGLVGFNFDAASYLGFTPTKFGVIGVTWRYAAGPDIVAGDNFGCSWGTSSDSRLAMSRNDGVVTVFSYFLLFPGNVTSAVANNVPVRAMGAVASGLMGSFYFQETADPGIVAPHVLATKAGGNGAFTSDIGFDYSYNRAFWIQGRGHALESVSYFDYTGLL